MSTWYYQLSPQLLDLSSHIHLQFQSNDTYHIFTKIGFQKKQTKPQLLKYLLRQAILVSFYGLQAQFLLEMYGRENYLYLDYPKQALNLKSNIDQIKKELGTNPLPKPQLIKKRHQFIYGNTNSGFLQHLFANKVDIQQISYGNGSIKYQPEMKIFVLDHFKGQLSTQQINQLCNGGVFKFQSESSIIIPHDCSIYILSDKPPTQIWLKQDLSDFETRFEIFEMR